MDRKFYTAEDWKKRWEENTTGWQRDIPHEFLVKYFDQLTNQINQDDKPLNVFLALCGKSLDINWLRNRNCIVHGVEIWPSVIKEFYEENGITYREAEVKQGIKNFQSEDGKISLFQCDIFQFDETLSKCKYDLIWDRASFVAINPNERLLYIKMLTNVLAEHGKLALVTMNYDPESSPGPPHYVLDEDIETYFDVFNVNLLETRRLKEEQFRVKNLRELTESIYIMTKN